MNDDSTAELLSAFAVAKEWVARINQAPDERTVKELVADFNVWSGYAKLRMEMAYNKRQMPTMLGRDLFHDYPLEGRRVLVPVAEQNVPHTDGAMP
jgi:hypothetical protein